MAAELYIAGLERIVLVIVWPGYLLLEKARVINNADLIRFSTVRQFPEALT
jgi:hypothetical protein